MRTSIKVQDHHDGKLVFLAGPNSRLRVLNFFYAFNFFIGSVAFSYLLLTEWNKNLVVFILALFPIVVCSIAFYRFINKATETEKLFVNNQRLEIIVSSLFKTQKRSFLLTDISDFKFLEKERFEAHPLKGEAFDYMAFQTEQQVIQNLHSEGRVSFVCNGRQIRFGKELTSWEFNELEVLLYDITRNDFRYTDKYEQQNFSQS